MNFILFSGRILIANKHTRMMGTRGCLGLGITKYPIYIYKPVTPDLDFLFGSWLESITIVCGTIILVLLTTWSTSATGSTETMHKDMIR